MLSAPSEVNENGGGLPSQDGASAYSDAVHKQDVDCLH